MGDHALLVGTIADARMAVVYPLALGAGMRLFADDGPAAKFALTGLQAYANGVMYLNYTPAAPGRE